MDKYQDDQWFSSPPSIRSTFILRLEEIKGTRIYTEASGLGWMFGVSRIPSPVVFMVRDSESPPENTSIRLEFLLSSTIFPKIDVPVTIKIFAEPGGNLPEEIEQKRSVTFGAIRGGWLSLGEYICLGSPSVPRICSIHVEFPHALGLQLPTTPPPSTLSFLHDSMLGLGQTDTKFYLFSRQNKAGRKTHPLPIFASSQALRGKSSYLDTLLTIPGFKESALVDIDSTPLDLANFSDAGYDYDSDSDLDSDDGDEGPSAPDTDNPLHTSRPSTDMVPETKVSRRIGRIVYIPDISYKTWKALIWYLYSGKIDFLPLRSQSGEPTDVRLPRCPPIDGYQPTCSPKSMYRLADKLGMLEFRSLSLAALTTRLTQSNILQESVCRFTSLFPEVQEVESDYLIANFKSIPPADFEELQHTLSDGAHPHSLALLLKITRKSLEQFTRRPARTMF